MYTCKKAVIWLPFPFPLHHVRTPTLPSRYCHPIILLFLTLDTILLFCLIQLALLIVPSSLAKARPLSPPPELEAEKSPRPYQMRQRTPLSVYADEQVCNGPSEGISDSDGNYPFPRLLSVRRGSLGLWCFTEGLELITCLVVPVGLLWKTTSFQPTAIGMGQISNPAPPPPHVSPYTCLLPSFQVISSFVCLWGWTTITLGNFFGISFGYDPHSSEPVVLDCLDLPHHFGKYLVISCLHCFPQIVLFMAESHSFLDRTGR